MQSEVSKRKEQELGRLRRDCEEELRQRDANLETVKSKHLQSMQEQEERLQAQARQCQKVEQEKQAVQEENNELKLVADNAARERANNDKGGFKVIVPESFSLILQTYFVFCFQTKQAGSSRGTAVFGLFLLQSIFCGVMMLTNGVGSYPESLSL